MRLFRLLAFDTSTDAMSVAVTGPVQGVQQVWQHDAPGGALASAALIPAIMDLMARAGMGFADLDAIVFGCGPGAFTGLRTACSVAQGLALGARARLGGPELPVLPVDTLLALAEEARHLAVPGTAPAQVLAMLDARMDEIYAASYTFDGTGWEPARPCVLGRPESLALEPGWQAPGLLLAGNVFGAYGARLPFGPELRRVAALPSAGALLRLAPALLAAGHGVPPEQALPTYIRDKVAQTSAERAAAKAGSPAGAAVPLPRPVAQPKTKQTE